MKLDSLLKKVQSHESVRSPPPADAELARLLRRKRKTRPGDKFAHVRCVVDTSAPALRLLPPLILRGAARALRIQQENMLLLCLIRNNHFTRGRVDCSWRSLPPGNRQYHADRVAFSARTHDDNRRLHRRLTAAECRLTPTAELDRWWSQVVRERARRGPWLLAPPAPVPDPAFDAPPGVKRPRVSLSLRIRNGAALGALTLELFSEACPRTTAMFVALLPFYVGHRFHSVPVMLVPEAGAGGELLLKVIGPEGQALSAYYPDDTLVEELKSRAIDSFYPGGEAGAARYKLVRVSGTGSLHDFLTLAQEQLQPQEELLLVELRVPMAGPLDLGAVRAPAPAAVAAATAALPPPRAAPRQPNLQSLLATNELSHELRKILISLVEAGARLAAAGPHYERALGQLRAALRTPRPASRPVVEVITPEEIALRMTDQEEAAPDAAPDEPAGDAYRRADHLQRFLDEFRAWRLSLAPAPGAEALGALRELGWVDAAAERALRRTGGAVPAAAAWLLGERGASVCELVDGLPDGAILQALLEQPQIQRGLLNTRMLAAFVGMVGPANSAALWLSSPHGSPLLGQISRTYHSEKYCLAVNQKVPGLFWSGGAGACVTCAFPPENFHFPHSAPGLLSMLVSADDEVSGTFSVTFKPLPQFDLRSVVFGRVIPSRTYETVVALGSPLSTQPVVEISAASLAAPPPLAARGKRPRHSPGAPPSPPPAPPGPKDSSSREL